MTSSSLEDKGTYQNHRFMYIRIASISFITFLLFTLNTFGQTKFIKGKIICEQLEAVPQVRIQYFDTILLAVSDTDGKFNIEIPFNTKTLFIGSVGCEWTSINLTDSCDQLDIILMLNGTYDYMSLKKVDKLRMKRFNKLPELHLEAFQKGIFTTEKACYKQIFTPNYKSK
jgi:hypothetical protein